MTERKESGGTVRPSARKAPTSAPRKKTAIARRPKSVSFQIRTSPETKHLAERVAEAHALGGRSKLDAEIYRRGLLVTMVLLGPGADGSYAGMSEQEVARHIAAFFDRQYAVLDRHQLLASYVYRVLPPGGMGQLAFLPPSTTADGRAVSRVQHPSSENEQKHYTLGEEAQGTLQNFAEEI